MGTIANIIARGIQPVPQIKSANEQEAERIALAQQQEAQKQAVQATALGDIKRRQLEQAERDQQAVNRAMQEWDPKMGGMALIGLMAKRGVSPSTAAKQAEALAGLRKEWASASETEQKIIKAQHEQAQGLLLSITQAQDVTSKQRLLEQALQTGMFKPEDLTPEALPNTINSLKIGNWVQTEGKTAQQVSTLKAQQGAAEAAAAKSARPTPGVDVPLPAEVEAQKKRLQPVKTLPAPVAGRDIPLPADVEAQKKRLEHEPLVQVADDNGNPIWVRQSAAVGKAAAKAPKPPTGAEKTALGFYNRAKEAVETLTAPIAGGPSLEERVGGSLISQARLKMPNIVQSDEQQAYNQAQRAFTEARLRKESGAAIPESEFVNDRKTYFAQPGDSPATIKQKRIARQTLLDGLAYQAGKAYDEFYGEPRALGANPPGAPGEAKKRKVYDPATGKLE